MADLGGVFHEFNRRLYLPDKTPFYAALGAIAANLQPANPPVWLFLVGPPSCGGTEILNAFSQLSACRITDDVSPGGLLSAYPGRDRSADATGGLLYELGRHGIILMPDFTTVLEMSYEKRADIMKALRRIFDGEWVRRMGTDGGRTFAWRGKAGFLAKSTPMIDTAQSAMNAMGERYIYCRFSRLTPTQRDAKSKFVLARDEWAKDKLPTVTAEFFAQTHPAPWPLSEEHGRRIHVLGTLAAYARSAVHRDRNTKEVIEWADPEDPTRLTLQLRDLLQGMRRIGIDDETAWRTTASVALDSVPATKSKCLQTLANFERCDTGRVASEVRQPLKTVERALQDLECHEVVRAERQGQGRSTWWSLLPQYRGAYLEATSGWQPDLQRLVWE